MVHRAPDSRLLTNLIANEKEYAKHLASLFPISHTALTSLSAYAAASPSAPARIIAAIVDLLAGADDAIQRYHHAIETWRDQLVALKDLEDDLSAVLRDRDILVTRLIKVSKATRDAHRSSRLIAPLTSGLGSASLSSLPSTNSTTTTTHYSAATHSAGSGSSPASANAKLAQAQAELQACETHLVAKERELDARRISIARDGLGARCRALIDCGWVWGEMGKQGLKALQALSVNGNGNGVTHSAVPSHPTYASDNSSVTPSQSASQTAARSVETSQEGPTTSREHEPGTHTKDQADLTIVLPPAHAIPDLTLPTGVRSQPPPNGDPAPRKYAGSGSENGIHAKSAVAVAPAPAPRRKRVKRPRRPPSQQITEASDEGSGAPLPPSSPNPNADPGANPSPRTPFPTTAHEAQETSSDDEQPVGSFKVVDNDPFAVMRRSMLGPSPSAPHLPVVHALPVVFASVETSPSKMAFPGVGLGAAAGRETGTGATPATKRERRTSMAFFGSLRGLFRKPKERERVDTEWEEGHKPNGHVNGHGRGWVTRTDARIKGHGGAGDVDSDDDRVQNGDQNGVGDATRVVNVAQGNSGTRLRKGRPRGTNESGVDGWATDSRGPGGVAVGAGAGLDRAQTRRGTIKPKKTSVADLRGSEQGHTDGEVDGWLSLEQAASKGRGTAKGEGDEEPRRPVGRRASVSSKGAHPMAGRDVPHRHTATTTGRKPSPPPPSVEVESGPRPASPVSASRSKTTAGPTKLGRRHPAAHAHAQNQSLMSLVADVTGPEDKDKDRARSLEIPRAPGTLERQREEVGRRASLTVGMGAGVGGPVKGQMPLRSALRNTSRTPSPAPAQVPSPAPALATVGEKKKGMEEEGDVLVRDSMSISSYETGRESLCEEEGEEERAPSPGPMITFPPPPVDPPPGMRNEGTGQGPVTRRKSVRVSLQPTFSPSPPTLYDEGEEDGHVRWDSTRRSGDVDDVWADSTSEEEVYRRARGLLSLAGKLDSHGKGKGRRR